MHYTVETAGFLDILISKVNDKIKEGYVPLGGLTIRKGDYPYLQTMVKHDAVTISYYINKDFEDPSGVFNAVIQPILDKAKA